MTDEQDTHLPPEGTTPTPDEAAAQNPGIANPDATVQPRVSSGEEVEAVPEQEEAAAAGGSEPSEVAASEDSSEESGSSEDAMLKMLDDLPQEDSGSSAEEIEFGGTSVSKAEFQQLSKAAARGDSASIDLLMDVSLPVSIELGRTHLSIADILSLGPGSVVELARLAGEPVDVMVNHKLVARGEVVVVDENFGVRITQLITPEERLKILGDE